MKRLFAALVLPFALGLPAAEVWIPGGRTPGADALTEVLKQRGLTVSVGGDAVPTDARLIVFPPGYAVSDALREKLEAFYRRGGAIVVTDRRNLGAPSPRPAAIRALSGFAGGQKLSTASYRDGSLKLRIPVRPGEIAAQDDLLVLDAAGDFNSEVLSVVLTGRDGRQFVHYADLAREKKRIVLRFADFVFTGADGESELEFTLVRPPGTKARVMEKIRPEEIARITVGVSCRHAWHDKGGSFTLAAAAVARDTAPGADDRRSGVLRQWTTQLDRLKIELPTSFLDPLDGTDGNSVPVRPRIRGREADDKHFADEMRRRAARRIVLADAPDGKPSAVLDLPASPRNPDPAWGAVVGPDAAGGLAARMAGFLLKKPHFADVMFDLAGSGKDVRLCAKIRITDPGREMPGELRLTVGDLPTAVRRIELKPGVNEYAVPLAEIPETFDWLSIPWSAELTTAAGQDTIRDRADAKNMTEYLLRHLDILQSSHPDGRWSHHFFADVYAARAMAVLGVKTGRPELTAKAERMIAGLIARQHPDGALPMGYGEQKNLAWVADNGTAALALVHLASWLPDRRDAYLAAVRRWYAWRESFRITPEKAAELRREFRDDAHTVPGFYGIGLNDGPYFGKGKKFARAERIERGPLWVLGISMASLPGYVRLTGDGAVRAVAVENLQVFCRHAKTLNFFSAETVFLYLRYLSDAPDRERAEALFRDFMRSRADVRGLDLFAKGGRTTLDHLPLLYGMRTFGSTQETRAALARAMLFQGSENSPYSIFQVGELYRHSSHGTSIAAARYAGSFTLVWLVELRYPGATLPKEE